MTDYPKVAEINVENNETIIREKLMKKKPYTMQTKKPLQQKNKQRLQK